MPSKPETMVRDEYAWQMRRQGLTYSQIADVIQQRLNEESAALGGKPRTYSQVAAWKAVQRHVARKPGEGKRLARNLGEDRLEDMFRHTMRILAATHYAYSTSGRLIIGPDGQPLEDKTVKLAAIARLQSLEESRRKLLGLDIKAAPATFSDEEAQQLLANLVAEEELVDVDADDEITTS